MALGSQTSSVFSILFRRTRIRLSGAGGGVFLDQATGQVLQSFAAARHHGEPSSRDAVVRLAVRFTTSAERLQMATFVRAAVLGSVLQDIGSGDEAIRVELGRWVEDEVTDERLAALFDGLLVLRHAGMAHVPWKIGYEFVFGGASYLWLLVRSECHARHRASRLGCRAVEHRPPSTAG